MHGGVLIRNYGLCVSFHPRLMDFRLMLGGRGRIVFKAQVSAEGVSQGHQGGVCVSHSMISPVARGIPADTRTSVKNATILDMGHLNAKSNIDTLRNSKQCTHGSLLCFL